ncbi:MAG: alanine--tRNA ligase, partial [Archaeoglobi archaeon]|nr:alanine--tRNA ligase [Archaeoglobi archaeon]
EIAGMRAESLAEKAEEFEDVKIVVEVVNVSPDMLAKIGIQLAKNGYVGVLFSDYNGVKMVAFSGDERVDARDLIKIAGRLSKGGGGGRKDLAQGAGQIMPDADEMMAEIFAYLRERL